ncbi:MAG TPA: lytic transglycosylase domain-containing protein, partial [Polyangiaceae bacterium]|nr:lytic transglycosylase domain-containing protein [Polyangiaceae bacterium]
ASRVPWLAISIALAFLIVLAGGIFLLLDGRTRARAARARASAAVAGVQAPASVAPTAQPGTLADPALEPEAQQLNDLVAKIHGTGGEESPELSALLNADAKATYQALAQPCAGNSADCESQRAARELLTPRRLIRHEPRSDHAPLPRWLAGLKIPAIGAHDHPDVQRWLEYYSSHSVGRELFQTMLFRCGAYQDLIEKTLVHYGLPQDLLAVVLTESGCVSNAESGVGARGLWQLMAPTARAYHLYVQDGVIDERISPVKSTEAAVRFLGDLYRKTGNWEIALASYNAGSGPFRILAKLRQVDEGASFWDLADAELLPEETAKYVPRIQAYAIILANLRHFDFSTAQMRTAEETADLEVPSGTRLGQVARAAGTSVAYLRALNPDLIGTVVPSLPSKRFVLQVPKAAAFRARDSLDQFLQEQLDLCVSSAFDWGREQFTAEMQAKCATRKRH